MYLYIKRTVEKSCQHYLFNFNYFFSFFLVFLSFLFKFTFLCKKTTVKLLVPLQQMLIPTPPLSAHLSPPLPQLLHRFCPNSLHRHYHNSFTAATATSSPLLPQLLHCRCRNSLHRHASFFASGHRNSLHDHRYNFVYHFFHSTQLSSAISTVASYTTNFIKFIANRRSVLSFWFFLLLNFYIYYAMKYMKIFNICYILIKIIFLYRYIQLSEVNRGVLLKNSSVHSDDFPMKLGLSKNDRKHSFPTNFCLIWLSDITSFACSGWTLLSKT